ncbi:acyl carrier protein 1, mitochondrial-like [Phalaenopsis equestris]|uniref:acyl carrier protein 1, mitochondrial-like n=1 Tax=Phalaenopsis equestris TaxID=78828 RepID=UPI0009E1BAB1|nr:acyl carrier protein 1, mitochondrial-like [Phalaenopsis equestris]
MQAAKTAVLLLRSSRSLSRTESSPYGHVSRAFAQSALSSTTTHLNEQDITDRVIDLLRSSPFIDPAKVNSAADFKSDLQLDVLESVQVITAVEDEFAIEIPDIEADNISNTSQLIQYISTHPQAK